MKQMFASYAPQFEMEGGEGGGDGSTAVVDAPPQGAEGGESPAPENVAPPAPPAAGGSAPAPKAGGAAGDDANKTYTGKELGEKVSERLKEELAKHGVADWKALGLKPSEIKERLARLEQFEKVGKPAEEKLTPAQIEDKKLRDFMLEKFPELGQIGKLTEAQKAQAEQTYQEKASAADKSMDETFKKDFGIEDPAQAAFLRGQVAASIMANPQDREAWFKTFDMKVVEKHVGLLKTTLEPILRATAARYVTDKKGQLEKLPPQMPKGGVPEPSSKKAPLTDDERVKGAFGMLSASNPD